MKLLIILVSLVCATNCLDFNCLKGPKFWCASDENARKCDRLVECSNQEIPFVCEICEKAIDKLEKFFPTIDEKQIESFLDNDICDNAGIFEHECKKLIDSAIPIIVKLLKEEISAHAICRNIHLCSFFEKTQIFNKIMLASETQSIDVCMICKDTLAMAKKVFSFVPPKDLIDLLKSLVCDKLPSELKDECSQLVNSFGSQAIEFINSLLDGDRTCPAIHLCPNSDLTVPNREVKQHNSAPNWQCQTCIDVMTVLKKDLKNVTASEVENLIDSKACGNLGILKNLCEKYVEEYTGPLIVEIQSTMTPQQICQKNEACPASGDPNINAMEKIKLNDVVCEMCEKIVDKVKSLLLNKENMEILVNFIKTHVCKAFGRNEQKCKDLAEKYTELIFHILSTKFSDKMFCKLFNLCGVNSFKKLALNTNTNSVECEACKTVFNELKHYLADGAVQQKIQNFLKNEVCTYFGKEETKCQQIVDEFFTIFINAIITELNGNDICEALHFCDAAQVKIPLKDVKCDFCEVVVKEAIQILLTDNMEKKLDVFMKNGVCLHLGFIRTECKQAVDTYLPYLFRIARQSLNSKLLCTELHLCQLPSFKNAYALIQQSKFTNRVPYKCQLCEFVINETRSLLTNSDIQIEIENFLKQEICPHFGVNQKKCVQDINEYYSLVINLLTEFLQPSICNDIGLCSIPKRDSKFTPLLKFNTNKECDICGRIYQFIKNIQPNSSPANNLLGLVNICSKLSLMDKQTCINHLKKLPQMDEALKMSKNQKHFCQLMKMCSNHVITKPIIVGRNPCTWGPGFWCKSRDHAKLCGDGAVNHCELHVWNTKEIHVL